MPTIVTQIEEVEAEIRGCEEKLDNIERSMRLRDMTDPERNHMKEEAKRVTKTLTNYRSDLKQLRKENWKSMVLSVLLIGLAYLTYHYIWAP